MSVPIGYERRSKAGGMKRFVFLTNMLLEITRMLTKLFVVRWVAFMARHELSLKYSSKAVTDLLRFYVIFRSVENKEDTTLSPCQTVLSVSMDDSLQFRCAGTIQAAIEKYIDHIGGKQPTREDDASSDLSTVEDAEEGEEPQKKQKQRRT
jgi:hypothetical protein